MSDVLKNNADYAAALRGDYRWAVHLDKPLVIGNSLQETVIRVATEPHARTLAEELKDHGATVGHPSDFS